MTHSCRVGALSVLLVAVVLGQSPIVQTLPPGLETTSTGQASATPFNTAATTMIHQYGFQTSMFNYQSVQRIDSIAFREFQGTQAGGTSSMVVISMTSCPFDINVMSTTFANNRGPDYTQVFSGSITWTAGTITPPGAWITVPLSTPFTYDPHLGLDLVVEVQTNDPANVAAANIEVSFGPTRTQSNTTSSTAVTSNAGLVTAALLLINSTPLPSLSVTSTGPGVGDLTVSLTDIPVGMTQGWTLISTNTANAIDTGPILGIYPTQTTFDVVTQTPGFGNPLAFLTGVPGGFFPTSPFSVGPGTLAFLTGQTWDFVVLGTNGGFAFVARSQVQRHTF